MVENILMDGNNSGNVTASTPAMEQGTPTGQVPAGSSVDANAVDINEILSKHKEKFKINGVERELTFAEIKSLAGKSQAADEKFRQAAEKEKSYSEIKSILENKDVKAFMSKAGLTSHEEVKELLEELLTPLYMEEEKQKLNPDAYRAEKAEQKLAEKEARDKKAEQEKLEKEEQEQQERQVHAYFAELDQQFEEGFKRMGMKPDRFYHDIAIREMRDALNESGHEISVYDALKLADIEVGKLIKRKLINMSANDVIDYIGKEGLKKIREFDTKKAVQANSVLSNRFQSEKRHSTVKNSNKKDDSLSTPNGGSRESIDEYFNRLRSGVNI